MASIESIVESNADYLRGLGPKFWRRFPSGRQERPGVRSCWSHGVSRPAGLQSRSRPRGRPGNVSTFGFRFRRPTVWKRRWPWTAPNSSFLLDSTRRILDTLRTVRTEAPAHESRG